MYDLRKYVFGLIAAYLTSPSYHSFANFGKVIYAIVHVSINYLLIYLCAFSNQHIDKIQCLLEN